MREKKWKNCPSCGSGNSMIYKKNLFIKYNNKNYGEIIIKNLDGYECKVCKEAIFTNKSDRKRQSELSRQIALLETKKTYASELVPIEEFAKITNRSRQRIHQMMDEGKIRYIFIGDKLRFPLRSEASKFGINKKSG